MRGGLGWSAPESQKDHNRPEEQRKDRADQRNRGRTEQARLPATVLHW